MRTGTNYMHIPPELKTPAESTCADPLLKVVLTVMLRVFSFCSSHDEEAVIYLHPWLNLIESPKTELDFETILTMSDDPRGWISAHTVKVEDGLFAHLLEEWIEAHQPVFPFDDQRDQRAT